MCDLKFKSLSFDCYCYKMLNRKNYVSIRFQQFLIVYPFSFMFVLISVLTINDRHKCFDTFCGFNFLFFIFLFIFIFLNELYFFIIPFNVLSSLYTYKFWFESMMIKKPYSYFNVHKVLEISITFLCNVRIIVFISYLWGNKECMKI